MKITKPLGIVGQLFGVKVTHNAVVGDPREHLEDFETCWCWEKEDDATPLTDAMERIIEVEEG